MSTKHSQKEFLKLLRHCSEISRLFSEGLIFIGGIAVYLHAVNNKATESYAEFTHDADFYLSIADMGDLRDIEEVTTNRRLNKHQLIKGGFEFDIYTERYSSLIVPYDAVMAYSERYEEFRVSCLEHLIVLKLDAYRNRFASSKGQKDARDILRIALEASSSKRSLREDLIIGYLNDKHLQLLKNIERGPEPMNLARGNAKLARSIRSQFSKAIGGIVK